MKVLAVGMNEGRRSGLVKLYEILSFMKPFFRYAPSFWADALRAGVIGGSGDQFIQVFHYLCSMFSAQHLNHG